MMLDDLEFQWKRGRLPNLFPAMELIMLVVLNADSPIKVLISVAKSLNVFVLRGVIYGIRSMLT